MPTRRYKLLTVNGKKVRAHQHLMEVHLGRKLCPDEHVHHVNGDITDNRIENLEVLKSIDHMRLHKQIYPDTKNCSNCGSLFTVNPRKRLRNICCSRACAYQLIGRAAVESRGIAPHLCREAREAEEARLRAIREQQEAEARAERERLEAARAAYLREQEQREAEDRKRREEIERQAEDLARRERDQREREEAAEAEGRVQEAAKARAAEIAAERQARAKQRPTDDEIIDALSLHFRVHESTVIGWLLAMDLEAASARMVAAI